ncbi:MAG TPA: hypothetical protein VFF65_08875 [Phycisphaerales bacterium]|nr:hypothetical protein [Phycisphaerales bacterium]
MSRKHPHDRQHAKGHHGKPPARDRNAPIGMVKQRSGLAAALAFGLLGFVILAVVVVIVWLLFA